MSGLLVIALGVVVSAGMAVLAFRRGGVVSAAIVAATALAAVLGYGVVGRPGLPGVPYAQRAAELADRDPQSLSPPEALARLQDLSREDPAAPEPHFFIGELLKSQGRDADAIRAYQSALRRDETFTPAMVSLADAMVRLSGGVIDVDPARIYARAYQLDQEQLRAGFLANLGLFQNGQRDAARSAWTGMIERLDDEDPRRIMLGAWVRAAEREIVSE